MKKNLIKLFIIFIVFLVIIIIVLFGLFWYFFLKGRAPGSYFEINESSKDAAVVECVSADCLGDNLKICSPAEGKTDLGDFAVAEIKILGESGSIKNSCVVYARITEIKEIPESLNAVPDFIINSMVGNLSLECLISQEIYSQGIDYTGLYISDNMADVCKGSLLDFVDKFGISL